MTTQQSKRYFHFALGPVQEFIAQARRTRDFWAGSFLLSWLAGVAMLAVEKQGGKMRRPLPLRDYLDWLVGEGKGEPPRQGCIPNRFVAEIGEEFDSKLVAEAVREAWQALAERIWEGELKNHTGTKVYDTWRRQVDNFWEIQWAISSGPDEDVLDRRKSWRTHFHRPEPGAKCTLMGNWQELSGESNKEDAEQFWEPLREKLGLDPDKKERLCAIAAIKRQLARHFNKDFSITLLPGRLDLKLKGWNLDASVPSVYYMVAVPWLIRILEKTADVSLLEGVHSAARAIGICYSEQHSHIPRLAAIYKEREFPSQFLADLDASVFFDSELNDTDLYPDRDKIGALREALRALKVQKPAPYYALLAMDVDKLGGNLSPELSKAVSEFTTKHVPGIVAEQHHGFLVYAGGDDLLALLPLDTALPCAAALHKAYVDSTKRHGVDSTISAAVLFAHVKVSLGKVIEDVRDLLKRVAKDGCGRDALAVRTWNPGGSNLEWGLPWSEALDEAGNVVIQALARSLRNNGAGGQDTYSSRLLYKLRDRFALFSPLHDPETGRVFDDEPVLEDDADAMKLLMADYKRSSEHAEAGEARNASEDDIKSLLAQCQPKRRTQYGRIEKSGGLDPDAALLARFLAQKGMSL